MNVDLTRAQIDDLAEQLGVNARLIVAIRIVGTKYVQIVWTLPDDDDQIEPREPW